MEKINDIKFSYRLPPIREMTEQQLALWKNLARIENEVKYLKNGLDIHPSGDLRVDYRVAAIYDTEYEFHRFLNKIKKTQFKTILQSANPPT